MFVPICPCPLFDLWAIWAREPLEVACWRGVEQVLVLGMLGVLCGGVTRCEEGTVRLQAPVIPKHSEFCMNSPRTSARYESQISIHSIESPTPANSNSGEQPPRQFVMYSDLSVARLPGHDLRGGVLPKTEPMRVHPHATSGTLSICHQMLVGCQLLRVLASEHTTQYGCECLSIP